MKWGVNGIATDLWLTYWLRRRRAVGRKLISADEMVVEKQGFPENRGSRVFLLFPPTAFDEKTDRLYAGVNNAVAWIRLHRPGVAPCLGKKARFTEDRVTTMRKIGTRRYQSGLKKSKCFVLTETRKY